MRSTDFSAIVSPIGAATRKRRLKGALVRFAEGGSTTDYTDPDSTISALNRALDALQTPTSDFGRGDLPTLGFQAGILSPTKSGSFLESLGSGYRGQMGGIENDRNRGMEIAKLRMQAPLSGLQAAGLAQNLKQQKLYIDALNEIGKDDTGGGPAIGVTPAGKAVAVPAPIGGAVPPITAAGPTVAGAPLNPQATPGAPGSTLTADPEAPGAGLRPVTAPAPPPLAAPRAPVVSATLPAPAGGGAAPPAQSAAPAAGGPGPNGMTQPTVDGALPVPGYLAQQYATLFNRMSKAARNPLTADIATKYEQMIKALPIPAGFAFLPDGSGIVPVGDKDPGYIERAKQAEAGLRPDGKGGYAFAPGIVASRAQLKGAEEGAGAAARLPYDLAKIVAETTEKNKYETVEVPINGRNIPMSRLAYKELWDSGGMAGQVPGAPAPKSAPAAPGGEAAPGAPKFGINPGEKELSTGEGKEVLEGRTQAENAASTQRGIYSALASIEHFPTGAFGEIKGELGNYLRAMGTDKKAIDKWLGSTEDYQILQKDFFKIAADRTRQLGSREPGFVLQSFQRASPNVSLLTDANRFLLHALNADSQYVIDMNKGREDWFTKNGNLTGFFKDFQIAHPPERYIVQAYVDSGNPVQLPRGALAKQMYEFIPPGAKFQTPDGKFKIKAGAEQ